MVANDLLLHSTTILIDPFCPSCLEEELYFSIDIDKLLAALENLKCQKSSDIDTEMMTSTLSPNASEGIGSRAGVASAHHAIFL